MAPLVDEKLLVVLLGPTASGKTALSLALAQAFSGQIVSCDSVAIYRGLDLGSAKPTQAEQQLAPHHLLDIRNPDQPYTAGDYARDARAALAAISARHHLPIVTGGTGLYLRALLLGLSAAPPRSDSLRTRLRSEEHEHGPGHLHRMLSGLDPAAAASIHPNDTPKLIRALEVPLLSSQNLSSTWSEGRQPLTGYKILRIGLDAPRPALYDRINARAAQMFKDGLLDETLSLASQYGNDCRPLSSLGYAQALAVLRNQLTLDEAIAAAQQGHRNYAKRQMTWFRREPDVHWLNGFGDDPQISSQALATVQAAMV